MYLRWKYDSVNVFAFLSEFFLRNTSVMELHEKMQRLKFAVVFTVSLK